MSAERKFCATVNIKPNCKNCFVELSSSIAKHCSQPSSEKVPQVIGIENSFGITAYASWTCQKSTSSVQEVLFIGKAFADCLSLKEKDLVLINFIANAAPCEKVCITPAKQKEWEILELNSELIEESLLGQIRIVYAELEFPVFLRGSAIVKAKVESVSPNVKVGYLEEFTELHIAPCQTKKPSIQKDQKQTSTKFSHLSKNDTRSKVVASRESSNNPFLLLWNFLVDQSQDGNQDFSKSKVNSQSRLSHSFAATPECVKETTHMNEVLRIHPYDLEKPSKRSYDRSYHPFRCFVNRDTFSLIKRQCTCHYRRQIDKVIAIITTIPSPRRKEEKRKIKAKNSENSPASKQDSSAVVEVVPVADERFPFEPRLKNAAVSLELMLLLDADQGALVQVTCVHKEVSPVLGIIINVLINEEATLKEEQVNSLFRSWAERRIQSEDDQILLNDSSLLQINTPSKPAVVVSVEFLTIKENQSPNQSYYLVNKEYIQKTSLVTNFCSDRDNGNLQSLQNRERILEKHSIEDIELGGLSELTEKGKAFIDAILSHQDSPPEIRPFSHKGSLLICASSRTAASGCGRTALANVLCNAFRQSPYFCHIENIDCISLRGKKPETILRRMELALEEARWRQPSIVVFDDVDYLIKQPDPLKDADPTVQYHSKLAEGLKDLLRNEMVASNSVVTVLISKSKSSLHEIFSTPSGWHFIETCLVLHPPDEDAREDILFKIAKRLPCTFSDSSHVRKMAALTKGHLPADLEIILKRAKHSSAMNPKPNSEPGLLDYGDFTEGLNGYKPLGLHGIALHSPGILGWNHVGGLAEAKKVLMETFVWPMKYDGLFSKCPFRMRSGVLLYGPSGTGKTLMAGVVAKECGMNFVSIKGPELLNKYVGSSEQNVRDLFARAQSASPCILFFDEFDALAPKRGHDNTGVTDRVVNQLLTQLDGVEKLEKVFVLAATSRPDLIDPALLRPGRLDKCVYCPMPDANDRVEIFKALSLDVRLDQSVDTNQVCENAKDFSGADIKALLYNAQLIAIHKRHPEIIAKAFESQEKVEISEEDLCMKISNDDIMEALRRTRPSVTTSDMSRYETIFRRFNDSRKGDYRAEEIDSRVTLA